ncbi:hypothetical protein HGO21_08240 [Acinetobacter sp. CUI P1]|nr:hypothetical protein [Acinetobacter sp. CUI P1]
MTDEQQKINVIQQLLQDKKTEKEELKRQSELIMMQMKQVDNTIKAFEAELVKLTGEEIPLAEAPLRGAEIGVAAVEALRILGGEAHYSEVKAEIEKTHTISGIDDKSKGDSVWNQLNKNPLVQKMGRGNFKFKEEVAQ